MITESYITNNPKTKIASNLLIYSIDYITLTDAYPKNLIF